MPRNRNHLCTYAPSLLGLSCHLFFLEGNVALVTCGRVPSARFAGGWGWPIGCEYRDARAFLRLASLVGRVSEYLQF
jgi:hypothetical protein